MRAIPPSLRISKRYVAFSVDKKLHAKEAGELIDKLFKRWYGEVGMARADVRLVAEKFDGNSGVIAVAPGHVQGLMFALSSSENPRFSTLGVSGMINKTKRFLNKD